MKNVKIAISNCLLPKLQHILVIVEEISKNVRTVDKCMISISSNNTKSSFMPKQHVISVINKFLKKSPNIMLALAVRNLFTVNTVN